MYKFEDYLSGLTPGFTPVIEGDYQQKDFVPVDLSLNNPELLKLEASSAKAFDVFIAEFLLNNHGKAAYGGYAEMRNLYNRSKLFNNQHNNRNYHIGLDIWVPAFTGIICPLDAKVHSLQDNQNFGDYGPTIILKHEFPNYQFHTLYGHLSRNSLKYLKEGEVIKKGERFAELGDFEENGDYAPHLHFQIIKDLQGFKGDYPGVVRKEDLEAFLHNCPDPNLLLKI